MTPNNHDDARTMRRRLLLIDDVPDNLEVLTVLLRDQYNVFSYISSSEALADVKDIMPDLLLLDLRMFPMNGVDFLKQVRAMNGFSRIPAIAVTALAHDADRARFLASGFQAIVTKPILHLPNLETIIDSLLKPNSTVHGEPLDRRYPLTA
jgi:putative two-component system response regulator